MNEFCEKCGDQLENGYGRLCDDCLEDWAEENEVYL